MPRYNHLNIDQAGELRRMVTDTREKLKAELDNNSAPRLHTLSILSGKGGVGKSNIAAALSMRETANSYSFVPYSTARRISKEVLWS